jgi:methionyl-tRNA formyltransferase
MALNIVFMGTPDFAVPALAAILAAGHRIVAVYSQPPRPAGRGMAEQPSPVHAFASAQGLGVHTPHNFKHETDREIFAKHRADVAVVVAYGLILPEPVLAAPRFGCFNIHASKLPRWRGAAPIQRAIMAGDNETSAMVMRMERGLDTGPICLSRDVAISSSTTAAALHDELAKAGAELIVEALARIQDGSLECVPQAQDGITYAAKIEKSEAHIDFNRDATDILRQIHALSPTPGCWFEAENNGKKERIKVLRAVRVPLGNGLPGTVLDEQLTIACRSGAVKLLEVQRAGKKPTSAAEFLRGFIIRIGDRIVS